MMMIELPFKLNEENAAKMAVGHKQTPDVIHPADIQLFPADPDQPLVAKDGWCLHRLLKTDKPYREAICEKHDLTFYLS